MADLTQAPPVLQRLPQLQARQLLEEAIKEGDWEKLKPYPQLLFLYQTKVKEHAMDIAKWVSHFRTGKHLWCKHE